MDDDLKIEIPGSPLPAPRYVDGELLDPLRVVDAGRTVVEPWDADLCAGMVLGSNGWHVPDGERPGNPEHFAIDWRTRTTAQARAAGVRRLVLCRDGWHAPCAGVEGHHPIDETRPVDVEHWKQRTVAEAQAAGVTAPVECVDGWYAPDA